MLKLKIITMADRFLYLLFSGAWIITFLAVVLLILSLYIFIILDIINKEALATYNQVFFTAKFIKIVFCLSIANLPVSFILSYFKNK